MFAVGWAQSDPWLGQFSKPQVYHAYWKAEDLVEIHYPHIHSVTIDFFLVQHGQIPNPSIADTVEMPLPTLVSGVLASRDGLFFPFFLVNGQGIVWAEDHVSDLLVAQVTSLCHHHDIVGRDHRRLAQFRDETLPR
jgi:hypothetical protein